MEESANLESLQITIAHGGVRTSLMCWSAIRMAVSSAVKIDTGGKEKDFLRLWNSGMVVRKRTSLGCGTQEWQRRLQRSRPRALSRLKI